MNPSCPFLARALLALALLLCPAAALDARPADTVPSAPSPQTTATAGTTVVAGFFSFRNGSSRTWVVRIAALGMALALFIIMRGSSRY